MLVVARGDRAYRHGFVLGGTLVPPASLASESPLDTIRSCKREVGPPRRTFFCARLVAIRYPPYKYWLKRWPLHSGSGDSPLRLCVVSVCDTLTCVWGTLNAAIVYHWGCHSPCASLFCRVGVATKRRDRGRNSHIALGGARCFRMCLCVVRRRPIHRRVASFRAPPFA